MAALFSPVVDGHKTCSRCRENKPVSDFYSRIRGGYSAACRACWAEHRKAGLASDPLSDYRRHLWAYYRLRWDAYEKLLESQGGRCAICRTDKSGARRWHVDHDHECCPESAKSCGKCVRGLLCHRCNLMLGNARDSTDTLRAAINYLGGK